MHSEHVLSWNIRIFLKTLLCYEKARILKDCTSGEHFKRLKLHYLVYFWNVFKRLMILFPWFLPLPFLHPSSVVLWFWVNKCFKMFLNSVEIPKVSLTEVTSDPLKLFLMIKLFLYPAEPSPPLVLCFLAAWVWRMLLFPFVGGEMKQTLWPKAITQILAWKSPLEAENASFSRVHLAALSRCLHCASPPERLPFELPTPAQVKWRPL